MDIKNISQIADLIIGFDKKLNNSFTNKEIIGFFVNAGINRDEIIPFAGDYKNPKRWLSTFLKDLYDNNDLEKYLELISDDISFYNPEFKNLIGKYISDKKETVKLNKKIGFLTPFDSGKDKKLKIFEDITRETEWKVETFNIYDYGDDKFLWGKLKKFLNELSLFIIDLRNNNKNVLLELGYILALNKEIIVILPEGEKVPSDLNGIIYIREGKADASSSVEDFQKVKNTFENELKNAIEEKIKK